MAEATVNTLYADSVVGDLRVRKVNVSAASTGDTITVPGFTTIFGVILNPPSSVNVIANLSGNVATLVYTGGGAMAGIEAMIFGI